MRYGEIKPLLNCPSLHGQEIWIKGLLQAVIGLLLGGGILYGIGTLAEWILKKEAMGGGDVKLLAMIGVFLGWKGVVWTLFMGSLLAALLGLYLRLRKGDERVPFGPFLSMAAFLYLWIGPAFFEWYGRAIGLYS